MKNKILFTLIAIVMMFPFSVEAAPLTVPLRYSTTTGATYLYPGTANQNLGLGTTSPYARLSVVGQVVATYYTATSTILASTFPYASTTALTVSTAAFFPASGVWNSTGIGIGITPSVPFQVSVSSAGANLMTLRNTSTTGFGGFDIRDASDNLALQFGYGNSAAGFGLANLAYIGTRKAGEPLTFITGGLNERGRFTGTGEFGVGTTTPRANFQVTNPNSNATTSVQTGKPGQNKGTCMTEYDTAGSPVYRFFAAGASTPTYQNGGTAPSGCIN